jgi:hypothetical protein
VRNRSHPNQIFAGIGLDGNDYNKERILMNTKAMLALRPPDQRYILMSKETHSK